MYINIDFHSSQNHQDLFVIASSYDLVNIFLAQCIISSYSYTWYMYSHYIGKHVHFCVGLTSSNRFTVGLAYAIPGL